LFQQQLRADNDSTLRSETNNRVGLETRSCWLEGRDGSAMTIDDTGRGDPPGPEVPPQGEQPHEGLADRLPVGELKPDQTRLIAARVTIGIMAYAFLVLLSLLTVSLVTSGGSWSALYTAMYDNGKPGFVGQMIVWVRLACELVTLFILAGIPAVLRRWLPWSIASGMARSLVPSWLAAGAAFTTWLYIVLMHFDKGALASYPLGLIVVSGLGAAALLAPLFQFVTRSCWEYGPVVVFDPVRWRSAFLAVFDEVRRARAARVSDKVGKPGLAGDPQAGPPEVPAAGS
jgi:hypothetical protein